MSGVGEALGVARGTEAKNRQRSGSTAASSPCSTAEKPPNPAPDAFDETRDAMHGVAVMSHDAAHAPLHVRQLPVAAREEQQATLARAVVCQGNLRARQSS